jgi:hypothetical protein
LLTTRAKRNGLVVVDQDFQDTTGSCYPDAIVILVLGKGGTFTSCQAWHAARWHNIDTMREDVSAYLLQLGLDHIFTVGRLSRLSSLFLLLTSLFMLSLFSFLFSHPSSLYSLSSLSLSLSPRSVSSLSLLASHLSLSLLSST